MKALKLISIASISVCILLMSILSFLGLIGVRTMNIIMLVGTVIWFIVTPLWMKEK